MPIDAITFHMDDREWVCIPEGPIRVLEVPLIPSMPPEVKEEWTLHNQVAHQVLDAIRKQTPLTLRELRGVFGQFKAKNTWTGHCIVSGKLTRAKVS